MPKNLPLRVVITRIGEPTLSEYAASRAPIDSPETTYRFWCDVIATDPGFEADKEHLVTLCLNTRLRPICYHIVSVGSSNETVAHPREILRPVILQNAHGFALAHNHPSGDPSPSEQDRRFTRQLKEGCEFMQIRMLDHVVIGAPVEGRQPYFSFREAGLL